MKQENPITTEGFKKIQEELDHLVKKEREGLKTTIAEARALGDLKENAEYHAAKEKQALVEGRIALLQSVIANAKIIDPSQIQNEKIVFGATVTLTHLETNATLIYQIVGQNESNTSLGKISFTSPLGKVLMGKEEGDEVVVKAPKGDIEYEIERIEYK